jgi:8-oxo-dGTP pyrophosphatase MutT (NUDIX family)
LTIFAAGTVLWRLRSGVTAAREAADVELALVHRPKYDDWSLPKGKCEMSEFFCATAVRETLEETGYTGSLGKGLGSIHYDVPGAEGGIEGKIVSYWSMHALGGAFTPSAEVDEIRWLPPDDALAALTRDADREPVDAFLATAPATSTVLLIRHADAGDRDDWKGSDDDRPLSRKGRLQAAYLASLGACFGVTSVVAADITRCVQTVSPLANALGIPVEEDAAFSEMTHAYFRNLAVERMREIAGRGGHAAICSQGGVIPYIIDVLRREDGVDLEPRARKGSVWVLSFADDDLVAAQYLPDVQPLA